MIWELGTMGPNESGLHLGWLSLSEELLALWFRCALRRVLLSMECRIASAAPLMGAGYCSGLAVSVLNSTCHAPPSPEDVE